MIVFYFIFAHDIGKTRNTVLPQKVWFAQISSPYVWCPWCVSASSLYGVLVTVRRGCLLMGRLCRSCAPGPSIAATAEAWGKHACHSVGLQPSRRQEQGMGIVVSAPVLRKLLRIAHIKLRRGFVVCFKYLYFFHSPHDVCFTGRLSANGRKKTPQCL